jgi:hypothetical protein
MSTHRDLVVRSLRGSGQLWEFFSETLDLPVPSLLGLLGSNPYGVDVGKLLHLRDTLVPETVMSLTLADIVCGAISDDEAVRARYLEWISKAKAELVGGRSSDHAVKAASSLCKELAAAKKTVKRSSALSEELKATGKKLDAHAKSATSIRLKINKGKKPSSIKADSTPIAEILSELLGRLGITDHVAYLSALVNLAEKTRSVTKNSGSSNSLGELAAQATSGPSLLALLSKGAHLVKSVVQRGGGQSSCTTVMGVLVCDSAAEGEGIPDGPSFGRRYVIHTDPMTLERGPGFRVDAFDVLETSLATFEIATSSLAKDKDHSRAYVLLLLDALADAFKMPASHKGHSGGKRGGGAGRMVNITTTTGGCALCAEEHVSRLEKLGMIGVIGQKGGKDKIVYVQNVPTEEQRKMDQQHLRNDTYSSGALGCLVGIEFCQCCMECSDYLGGMGDE